MTQQQRSEDTQDSILSAAASAFAEQGYDATGVAEICRRAGVSKGAFYYHFSSKQELFLHLLQRWLEQLDAQLADRQRHQTSAPEELLNMTDLICHVFEAADEQLPMFLEFWAKAARDPNVWEATITPYRQYRAFFAELIASGKARGELRDVDPDTAARVIVSLAVGLVLQGLLDREGADWSHVSRQAMEMLLHGIESHEGDQRTSPGDLTSSSRARDTKAR